MFSFRSLFTGRAASGAPNAAPVMTGLQGAFAPERPAPSSRPFNPARIRHPRIREFHGLWEQLRGDRASPARGDFGPEDFRPMLPHLFLVEVERAAVFRFVFRIVGTELERQLGRTLAQQEIEPLPQDRWAGTLYGAYANCAITLRPVYDYMRTRLPDGTVGEFERLTLPVSADGLEATHLIGCAILSGSFSVRDAWGRAG